MPSREQFVEQLPQPRAELLAQHGYELRARTQAPVEVEKSLFEHFFELISDSGIQRSSNNIRILREYHLVEKLLVILKKSESSSTTTLTLLN